jgi:hypothetical protein
MLDKKVFDSEKISIIDFKLIRGQVENPEHFDIDKVDGHDVDNSLELGFNFDEKLIKSDYSIEIKTNSKGANKVEASGNFHFVFIFEVENLDLLVKINDNNSIELDPMLGNAISSITYSTSRGILLTRLQGTALQNFVLPIIDPNKLLHKIKNKKK